MTCTAHAAELGPLPHTVQRVQAVRAQRQWFAMSLPSPGHKAMTEVPFGALKLYAVLSKHLETSAPLSARGQDQSIVHAAIMSISVST